MLSIKQSIITISSISFVHFPRNYFCKKMSKLMRVYLAVFTTYFAPIYYLIFPYFTYQCLEFTCKFKHFLASLSVPSFFCSIIVAKFVFLRAMHFFANDVCEFFCDSEPVFHA